MKAWILVCMTIMSPLLFAAEPLALYDKKNPPLMYGVGAHSCGMYLDNSVSAELSAPYDGFLSGYATSQAVIIGGNFFHSSDAAGIKHWLQNFCTAHPTAHYAQAVFGVVQDAIDSYLKE
jgi:hypothetical protein